MVEEEKVKDQNSNSNLSREGIRRLLILKFMIAYSIAFRANLQIFV